MLPSRRDVRAAFLLPRYVFLRKFARTNERQQCLLRFATIIGFIGMLRPHTFRQLQPTSFTLVIQNGDGRLPPHLVNAREGPLFTRMVQTAGNKIIGLFANFKSKTMLDATAYFPNLSEGTPRYKAMCPVTALQDLIRERLFKHGFLKKWGRGNMISSYLK